MVRDCETLMELMRVLIFSHDYDGICSQLSTSVMREVSHPTSPVPTSPLSFSLRPSRRLVMKAKSRLASMLLLPSSTRRASTILTSRTPTPIPPSGSPARSWQIYTLGISTSTQSCLLRIPSIRMTGRPGLISPPKAASKSSVMISLSPTPSVSRLLSKRRLATACC